MSDIELTPTVRALLSNAGATALTAILSSASKTIRIERLPITLWLVNKSRNEIRCPLLLQSASANPPEPITRAISFELPAGAMSGTVIEEEHRWLTIKDGQVWTVGALAMHDPDVFRGLDCLLSIEAYLRVVACR